MIENIAEGIQLFLTKSGEEHLCSCPQRIPSFVVRHKQAENAKQLMLHILNSLNGEKFSVPEKADVNLQKKTSQTDQEEFVVAQCDGLLPGYYVEGPSIPIAVQKLNEELAVNLPLILSGPEIFINPIGSAYQASCPSEFPASTTVSASPEEAYNDRAKIVTDYRIKKLLKKQFDSPVIVTGSFHSGTSALALLLQRNGVSMGRNLNWAYDEMGMALGSPEIGPFMGINDLIMHYYPNKQAQLSENELLLLRDYFFRLVETTITFPHWGWKTPSSTFLMPLFGQVFPGAKFLHIVRDGRDVALSPHSEVPNSPLRKLFYFDTSDVDEWEGEKLTPDFGTHLRSKCFDPPPTLKECELFAMIWEKMSLLGDRYGRDLGSKRYLQVRFEELCLAPEDTVSKISEFLGIPLQSNVMQWKKDRVGKYKNLPSWAAEPEFVNTISARCREGLGYFGYE